jgi:hypothetical protein
VLLREENLCAGGEPVEKQEAVMSEPFSGGGGVNAFNPSVVGGTGTTAKIFPNLLTNATGLPAAFGIGSPPAAAPYAGAAVVLPGTGAYEQQQISVVASGYVFVHGTTPTINIVFQQGSSLTAASNTTIATLSAVQTLTTNASYPWSFSIKMMGDAVSGVLQLFSPSFVANGVSGAFTATVTDLTGVNLTTTSYPFVIGITFGVSDALNKGILSQFSLTAS